MPTPGRRRLVLALASLAVLAGFVWAFRPRPVTVDLAAATRGALVVTVDEEGHTRVRERYTLSAPAAGTLSRIALKAGAAVGEGEVVARIIPAEPTPLDARTRAQWRSRSRAAEDALAQARTRAESARAELEFAVAEARRREALAASGTISADERELAETRRRTADAEVRSAESAIRVAEHELEEARAALRSFSTAAGRPQVVEVRSPRAGRILRVIEESERTVAAGTPLLEVGDPADLEVVVDLLSSDAVRIAPGARVLLERWGGESALAGRVRLIEPYSFMKISALGVEEQRVNVLIDVTDPPDRWSRLGDGYAVETRIVVAERKDALKIPVGALFRDGDRWATFEADSGRATLRILTLGLIGSLEAEVLQGLREDARVVVHPGDAVENGVRIVER